MPPEHSEDGSKEIGRNYAPTLRAMAKPEQFMLAPAMCAVMTDMAFLLLAMALTTQFNWPGFILFLPIITHLALVLIGLREPQIDYLLRCKLATPRPAAPSRTQRERHPGAVRVLSPATGKLRSHRLPRTGDSMR